MKTNIREYSEEMEVVIKFSDAYSRWVIRALNEGGLNFTEVDLLDLICWIKENRPDLL